MDDALLVRGVQGVRDLFGERQRFGERDRPSAMRSASVGPSTSSMTSAWTPLPSLRPSLEAVDDRDVGMAERRERLGFPLEARQAIRVLREGVGQHLDRHLSPEVRVGRPIHLTHAAHTDLSNHFIWADASAGLQ